MGTTDSMQKESRRALLCKVGKDARHQTARSPERAACKRMRTAKHPIPGTHAVCVCACAYRPIRAYLKNKELFIGMIFPLLLSDVLLLKFHYLLWQVDLFRELDCKNRFLVACPAPGSQPPPLSPRSSWRHPGQYHYRDSQQVRGRARLRRKRLPLEHLHFETPAYRGKNRPF